MPISSSKGRDMLDPSLIDSMALVHGDERLSMAQQWANGHCHDTVHGDHPMGRAPEDGQAAWPAHLGG